MSQSALIQLEHLTKRFGGVSALDDVGFDIAGGEVHAVVGENGAGKSTLMKLLAGVYEPDAGRILLRGQPVRLRSPLDARRQGISIVYQELNLFPHRSVAANIFANRELTCGPLHRLDVRAMRDAARRTLEDMGVVIDPAAPVGRLTVGEQQLVEIARALSGRADIVILDEPNSALGEHESRRLFDTVRRLRDTNGTTFVYVSHRLEEVFAIADRITVLRDGRYQGTDATSQTSIPNVIAKMVGGAVSAATVPNVCASHSQSAAPRLRVTGLAAGRGPRVGPIDFDARPGEIVGFAGLEGAGVGTLFHAIFGLERITAGGVTIDGERLDARSPRQAIARGLALVPASRREHGLVMTWSLRRNAATLVLRQLLNRLGLLSRSRSAELASRYVSRLNIAARGGIDQRVVSLSGGNQQKVLLAKWLATGPRVLILNDPTRGVDVAAKAEIHRLCADLARQGLTILFSSSDWDETLAVCDRVLVLRSGRVVREFARGEATRGDLLYFASAANAGAPSHDDGERRGQSLPSAPDRD